MADLPDRRKYPRSLAIRGRRRFGGSHCDAHEGGSDVARGTERSADRTRHLGSAADPAAVGHRHLENAKAHARSLHLHLDVPAVGGLAHAQAFETVTTNGAIGAHVSVAHA